VKKNKKTLNDNASAKASDSLTLTDIKPTMKPLFSSPPSRAAAALAATALAPSSLLSSSQPSPLGSVKQKQDFAEVDINGLCALAGRLPAGSSTCVRLCLLPGI